jgi:imidazolonepropionase-like amidohydrolase
VTNGVIQNGTILFEDGRITAIGANVQIPTHAERVDATGKHIYPGLVDAHNVLGMFEIGGIDVTIDVNELGDFNPNVRAHVAVNPESRHLGVARSNGVLVSVSSPSGGIISGHSSAMMLDGWTWEQMTLKPETGLIVNWPSAMRSAASAAAAVVAAAAAARAAATRSRSTTRTCARSATSSPTPAPT